MAGERSMCVGRGGALARVRSSRRLVIDLPEGKKPRLETVDALFVVFISRTFYRARSIAKGSAKCYEMRLRLLSYRVYLSRLSLSLSQSLRLFTPLRVSTTRRATRASRAPSSRLGESPGARSKAPKQITRAACVARGVRRTYGNAFAITRRYRRRRLGGSQGRASRLTAARETTCRRRRATRPTADISIPVTRD